jgi:hypothetical protein
MRRERPFSKTEKESAQLQNITIPENLKMKMMNSSGIILPFGDCILMAGYYDPNGRSH